MRELRTVLLMVLVATMCQPLGAHAWRILAAFNPSPQTWSTSFEADPANTDSIALADDHMRQIKFEIRQRAQVESDFGNTGNVTTDTGRMLEGSARVFVQNAPPSVTGSITATCLAEADRNTNRGCDEGRIWVDPDGADNNAGTTPDNFQVYAAQDSDSDGDADTWQPLSANTAGGIGGTVPTNAIVLWDQSSTCPAGYAEATEFRNVSVRGADIAVTDSNIPNGAGTTCSGSSAPAGCGAAGGTANYNDTNNTNEMPSHTHTVSAHTHTFSDGGHTHTIGNHTHTMAHTHDVTVPPHTHTFATGQAAGDSPSAVEESPPSGGSQTTSSGGGGTFTTTGSSAANTGSSGSGNTGSTVSSGTTSSSGGGSTGSAGGSEPDLGPFRTVLFCRKT